MISQIDSERLSLFLICKDDQNFNNLKNNIMPLPNIFTKQVTDEVIQRINRLKPESKPLWGKMNSSQMLKHCAVPYEMLFENIHPKPNAFMKFILKILIKNKVVNETPFPHNSKTSPQFIISDKRDFELEKKRLVDYLNKTQQLGENYFENKESQSFGALNKTEWNNMFYKHLDHHLQQFGV